jgi:hypothetical protein
MRFCHAFPLVRLSDCPNNSSSLNTAPANAALSLSHFDSLIRSVWLVSRDDEQGKPVRYLRSTFLPSEEKSYCLFDAPSAERVKEANERAQIPLQRIVEVKHIAAEDVG